MTVTDDDPGDAAGVSIVPHGADDPPPADELAAYLAQLRRRREAALRLPPMPCGHRDPLDCRAS